jgi:predicted GNAT superfamily acetyltransferase
VPADIEALRSVRPEIAREWRYALREILEPVLSSGGRILGLDAQNDYVVRGDR